MTFRLLSDLTKKPELKEVPQHFVIFLEFDDHAEYLGFPAMWIDPEAKDLASSGRWSVRGVERPIFTFDGPEEAQRVLEELITKINDFSAGPAGNRIIRLRAENKPYRFGIRAVVMHEFEVIAFGQ